MKSVARVLAAVSLKLPEICTWPLKLVGVDEVGDVIGAEKSHEGRADAVEHRVAAGEYDCPGGILLIEECRQRGHERAGQRNSSAGYLARKQVELPGAADDHRGRGDDHPGGRRKAVPAVGAEADDSY